MVRGGGAGARSRTHRGALTSRPRVERLLDAARAAASPRELAREDAAVDLFHRARLAREVPVTSRSARTGLKAAGAVVAAVFAMSSGVSFAATGHVPFAGSLQHVVERVTGQSAAQDAGSRAGGHRTSGRDGAPAGPRAQALPALCQAYQGGQKAGHGQALLTWPFRMLVSAAGGPDQVATYCASLPARGPVPGSDPTHPSRPSHPTHGTTQPTGGPSPHPTKPTDPTTPAQPTQPATPTTPTHPTSSPHPTHTPKPHPSRPTRTAGSHPTH
jgi:hypothetical protein